MEEKNYQIPDPIFDKKEEEHIELLIKTYKKISAPSKLSIAGNKIIDAVPDKIKNFGKKASDSVKNAQIYQQTLKVIANGFSKLEQYAAKTTLSEKQILEKIQKFSEETHPTSINEICLVRSYQLEQAVKSTHYLDRLMIGAEGFGTGVLGFPAIPLNLAASTFLYYRTVQSIAIFYGYDVKNDPAELIIAGTVFAKSISPSTDDSSEIGEYIAKVMMIAELGIVKKAANKGWQKMAEREGLALLIAQMRALANKNAQKALEKAGRKGLEKSVFKEIFESIGEKLTLKVVQRAVPVVSGVIGACFDYAQMEAVIKFANTFYHKRFLEEKAYRINELVHGVSVSVYTEEYTEIKNDNSTAIKNIIFDTDAGSDCDDMMALGYLIQAQKEKKIKINAVTYSHVSPHGAAALRATFRYFGEDAPPVGVMVGGMGLDDRYAQKVAESFATEEDRTPAEPAVTVLRRALAECDGKTTICAVGPLTNIGALLKSQPDSISPLNGVELVAEKCDRLVLMAGLFTPNEKGEITAEWNVKCDISAARIVADSSPVPIAWLPFETGWDMITGIPMIEKYGEASPIALSFILFPGAKNGRHSWDPTTALYTVEGCKDFFIERHGKVTVNENGVTSITDNELDNNCALFINTATVNEPEMKTKVAEHLNASVMKLHENR